jgi:hypothetical protein
MLPRHHVPMSTDWAALRRLAENQADILTRAQCLEAGMPVEMLRWRVESGRWFRLDRGVYLVKPGRNDWLVHAQATFLRLLSGGPVADAAFSDLSAAYLFGLEKTPPRVLDFVVPKERSLTRPKGTRLRRVSRWSDLVDDIAYPWRTTKPVTVLDLAADGPELDALSVISRAVQREVVTVRELRQELRARGHHRHGRLLAAVLSDVEDGAQSGAEVLYVHDVERAHGLPTGTRQGPSDHGPRRYHDNEYAEYALMVEVDGRLGHERWSDRVRDGQRDRQLLGAATATIRVFWSDVAVTPCQTAAELAAILHTRGWVGRARPCRRMHCALRRR